jgi:protein-tyrosine phosphatase
MNRSFLRAAADLVRSADARADAFHEWRRRFGGEPGLPPAPLRNVVIVCQGNICRSPFAAAVLRERIPALEVRSRGLAAGAGAPADRDAVRAAARLGVRLDDHVAELLRHEDLAWADLLLVMQGRHVARVRALAPEAAGKLRLLGDFLAEPPYEIPDPWGLPDDVFDRVFARTLAAVRRVAVLLEACAAR